MSQTLLGVRQRSVVGANIEGILGVNRVVTEEKSPKKGIRIR